MGKSLSLLPAPPILGLVSWWLCGLPELTLCTWSLSSGNHQTVSAFPHTRVSLPSFHPVLPSGLPDVLTSGLPLIFSVLSQATTNPAWPAQFLLSGGDLVGAPISGQAVALAWQKVQVVGHPLTASALDQACRVGANTTF